MPDPCLFISEHLQIPSSEIGYRYARSGGPGGQHVNRSETQVELLWDVQNSPTLSDSQRQRLLHALSKRIDSHGVLHLTSSQTRSQERNRQGVNKRFVQLVQAALKPRRKRRKTRVPRAERARRLDSKKRRSQIKRGRGRVSGEE